MNEHYEQAHHFCPACGRRVQAADAFCRHCGNRLALDALPAQEEHPSSLQAQERQRERDGRYEALDSWLMLLGGALLLIASVASFSVGLVLFGSLAAWPIGIAVFVFGMFFLAKRLGGPGSTPSPQ